MKKSPLYTRTGDTGTTSLVDGSRTTKNSPRLEAYGAIDELNAAIAIMATDPLFPNDTLPLTDTIQNTLFDIGAYLATPVAESTLNECVTVGHHSISTIEQAIDTIDAQLPPLHNFILPGGTSASAHAHLARTICRRAERRIITLSDSDFVDPNVIRYINRLSDLLFAIARKCNVEQNIPEKIWNKPC